MSFLERRLRDRPGRPPLMAEIGLVSSHLPWLPAPPLLDWDQIGDGTIYEGMEYTGDPEAILADPDRARANYAQTIEYSLTTLVSYLETYGDDLVLIFLGDHQPAPLITGEGAGRDVPITIVARDPTVLNRITSWGWHSGLNPGPQAPVWPMEAFRDQFLTAYSPGASQS